MKLMIRSWPSSEQVFAQGNKACSTIRIDADTIGYFPPLDKRYEWMNNIHELMEAVKEGKTIVITTEHRGE